VKPHCLAWWACSRSDDSKSFLVSYNHTTNPRKARGPVITFTSVLMSLSLYHSTNTYTHTHMHTHIYTHTHTHTHTHNFFWMVLFFIYWDVSCFDLSLCTQDWTCPRFQPYSSTNTSNSTITRSVFVDMLVLCTWMMSTCVRVRDIRTFTRERRREGVREILFVCVCVCVRERETHTHTHAHGDRHWQLRIFLIHLCI